MVELLMKSNKILRLDFQQRAFEYCEPDEFTLWVEVFVEGDIPLRGLDYSWDKVIDTGRHRLRLHPDDCDDSDYDDNYYDDDRNFDDNDMLLLV